MNCGFASIDAFQHLIYEFVSDYIPVRSRPSAPVLTSSSQPMSTKQTTPELEYADESYLYLKERETKREVFHFRSPQESYRKELIQRIQVLCQCYRFSDRVKHLSVYILDYFMDNFDIIEDRLELVLICSLVIAAKVDENDIKIPKFSQLFSSRGQFPLWEANEMEERILKHFDWTFLTPTAATYIDFFYEKLIPPTKRNGLSLKHIEYYMGRALDLNFYQFRPSLVAASIIYCVRQKMRLFPTWTKAALNVSKYSVNQLQECVRELTKYEVMAQNSIQTVVDNSLDMFNDSGIFECII